MSDNYIQIPPDSSGKAIKYNVLSEVSYTGGIIAFAKGDPITGASSGVFGTIVEISGTISTGTLHVFLDPESTTDWTVGENLQTDGITHAQVAVIDATIYLTPAQMMGKNPFNVAEIDNAGALSIRYSEGTPQLDAFGLSRYTTPHLLASYTHVVEENPQGLTWQYLDDGVGGSKTYLTEESAVALDVDNVSGSYAIRQTNRYHTYQPGFGLLIEMTVLCGDSGKSGCTRRWGYFDDYNGVFFQLEGTTFSVVQRSSTGGTAVDDDVITQANFNGDHVDGADDADNLSGFSLNLDTLNLFWIDVQWLGAGAVRFGMYSPTVGRVVLHTFANPNTKTGVYMQQPNLPIRYEVVNTSATAGPSRITMACAAIKSDGEYKKPHERPLAFYEVESNEVTAPDDDNVPVLTLKPSMTYGVAGKTNRRTSNFINLSVHVKDNPIVLRYFMNATLTGDSYVSHPAGSSSYDKSATSLTGGNSGLSKLLDVGVHNLDLPLATTPEGFGGWFNLADGSGEALRITIAAKSLPTVDPTTGTSRVTVYATVMDFD